MHFFWLFFSGFLENFYKGCYISHTNFIFSQYMVMIFGLCVFDYKTLGHMHELKTFYLELWPQSPIFEFGCMLDCPTVIFCLYHRQISIDMMHKKGYIYFSTKDNAMTHFNTFDLDFWPLFQINNFVWAFFHPETCQSSKIIFDNWNMDT